MIQKKPSYRELENELSLLKGEIGILKSIESSDTLNGIREYKHIVLKLKENEQELIKRNREYLVANEKLEDLNDLLVKAKEQIEKSEEKLQLIIKNSNDIFVLVNEKGEQVFVSDAAEKLTGYTTEELSGPIEDVIYPDDVDIIRSHWAKVIESKKLADRIEYRHIHKQKGYIWLEAIAQNYLDHPAINSVVANVRDITERKEVEEALRKSEAINQQLYKLERNRIFNELVDNQKKLASATLRSIENAGHDVEMIKQLEEVKHNTNNEGTKTINTLISNYKRVSLNLNWQEFETVFEKVHHSFYEELNKKFPNLTANEIKICAFLKLNMSSKDISQITYQSNEALKKARFRLRQKLGISREVNINTFLNNI